MRYVVFCTLLTISILLIIIMICIGRELHKIRLLLLDGASQITGYLNVVLSNEEEELKTLAESPEWDPDIRLTDEEKQLLWQGDAERLFSEVIGDIFS